MATAVVEANHMVAVPMLNIGERVTVFTDTELEKERHNAAYFADLKRRIEHNKLIECDLIEVDDEDTVG